MTPRADTTHLPVRSARRRARPPQGPSRAALLLLGPVLATLLVAAPVHAAPPRAAPTFAWFCLDGLAKPQLCIQWSKRDVRRFDDLVAGVGATAATQWLCDKVPPPAQLAIKAACVAVLGLYFGRIIRTFQVAADKGQCVRLRFILPPAAVNGWWRISC